MNRSWTHCSKTLVFSAMLAALLLTNTSVASESNTDTQKEHPLQQHWHQKKGEVITPDNETELLRSGLVLGRWACAKRDCVVLEGPDKGKTLPEGWVITCSRFKKSRVWASGAITGWISSDELVSFTKAEEFWKQKTSAKLTDLKSLVAYARIQMQAGSSDAALETVALANRNSGTNLSDKDSELAVIAAIADWQKRERTDWNTPILIELAQEHRLTDYTASLLLAMLVKSENYQLRETILKSVEVHTVKSSCWLLEQASRIAADQEQYGVASKLNDSILCRDLWNVIVMTNQSFVLSDQARYNEALSYASKSAQLWPEDHVTQSQLGNCYFESGDRKKGVAVMRKALQLAPHSAMVNYLLGRTLVRDLLLDGLPLSGEVTAEAIMLLKKACVLSEYKERIYVRELAALYTGAGQTYEAEELLDLCAEKFSSHQESLDYIEETRSIISSLQSTED